MSTVVLAHQVPGFQASGFSPGLVLYLTLAALLLLCLTLRVSWPTARFGPVDGAAATWPGEQLPGPARGVLRGLGLLALAFLLLCGWAGSEQIGANPIWIAMFIVFWIGGQLASLLVGDWWRLIDPFDTLAAWVSRRPDAAEADLRDEGERRDWWVPAALLFTFSWMWLGWVDGVRPRSAAGWLTLYTVVMAVGASEGGRAWVRRNEAFAVAFGLLAAVSPVDWTGPRPRLRNPLSHVGHQVVTRREGAVLAVLLGTVLFDAVGSTAWWARFVGVRSFTAYSLFNTIGLAWLVLSVGVVWVAASRVAARFGDPAAAGDERVGGDDDLDDDDHDDRDFDRAVELLAGGSGTVRSAVRAQPRPAALALAAPLALLAGGFAVSHEFSSLVTNSQNLLALLSDPLARGWDLLGTGAMVVNPNALSAGTQAWVSLGLIEVAVLGTYLGLHDRCVARFGTGATRATWAMLGFSLVAAFVGLELLVGV